MSIIRWAALRIAALVVAAILCTPAWSQDGKMTVVYTGAKKPHGKILDQIFKDTKPFEALADSINRKYLLPRDILMVLGETGVANCWYSPNQHRIYISYEIVDLLLEIFRKIENENEARADALGTLFFIVQHELAHCLIGELDIPVTGKEEDAADDFAVISLNDIGTIGQKYSIAAARWFGAMASRSDNKDLPFWDEHSLDMQRFYDIFGTLYGSNPNRFIFVEKIIPAQRLARHEREYARKKRSWERLLTPHLRRSGN